MVSKHFRELSRQRISTLYNMVPSYNRQCYATGCRRCVSRSGTRSFHYWPKRERQFAYGRQQWGGVCCPDRSMLFFQISFSLRHRMEKTSDRRYLPTLVIGSSPVRLMIPMLLTSIRGKFQIRSTCPNHSFKERT